jgi:nucleoside-diphosphate-sugar epimerase
MKILVTGASGFLGRRLADELLASYGRAGHTCCFCVGRGIMDFLNQYDGLYDFQVVRADVTDRASLEPLFPGTDWLFHLAARVDFGAGAYRDFERVNVAGAGNVFSLALQYGVKKVIYVSTAIVFQPSPGFITEESTIPDGHVTHYARSKYEGYRKALAFAGQGLPVVTVCPSALFGEGSPLFAPLVRLARSGFVILPRVQGRWSLLYVGDLAKGLITAAEKGRPGGVYMMSGQNVLTLEEMTGLVAGCLPRRVRILEVPLGILSPLLKVMDRVFRYGRIRLPYNREMLQNLQAGLMVDDRKARAELGFRETDFQANFARMVESYR